MRSHALLAVDSEKKSDILNVHSRETDDDDTDGLQKVSWSLWTIESWNEIV